MNLLVRYARRTGFWLFGFANRHDPDTKVTCATTTTRSLVDDVQRRIDNARFASIIEAEQRREARRQHPSVVDRAMPEGS